MSTSDNATCRSLSFWLAVILGVLGFLLAWKWLGWGVILSLIAGAVVLLVLWFVLQRALCGEEAAGNADAPSGTGHGATTSATPAAAPRATPEPAPTARSAPAPEPPEAAVPPAAEGAPSDAAGETSGEAEGDGARPPALDAPRGGKADDLKKIKGIGPALERQLNGLGIWHFDQIAAWTPEQVAWIDGNLVRFKGRATRDGWVEQARVLAAGGETEFSKRVDKGDVY